MKTAEEFEQSMRNMAFKGHPLTSNPDVVDLDAAIECGLEYAKEHAIKFAIWSDSEDCLIALDHTSDIEGEHIEEKCYRIWINTKQQ